MTDRSMTINVPDSLYHRIKRRADTSGRSVEREVVELLVATTPTSGEIPPEITATLASLTLLNDDELWRAARTRVPKTASTRLQALHFKRQDEGLTDQEAQEAALLMRQYDRTLLVRARAAALLKERGFDVSNPARFA